jgi:hypothetical protein
MLQTGEHATDPQVVFAKVISTVVNLSSYGEDFSNVGRTTY